MAVKGLGSSGSERLNIDCNGLGRTVEWGTWSGRVSVTLDRALRHCTVNTNWRSELLNKEQRDGGSLHGHSISKSASHDRNKLHIVLTFVEVVTKLQRFLVSVGI